MSPEEALGLLGSDHPHDRLRAARALAEAAKPAHAGSLRTALARETVPWVKRALELAVAQTLVGPPAPLAANAGEVEQILDSGTLRDVHLKASEEVVSTVLHEIQPKLGYIRNAAMREVPNFQDSDTRRRIERLEELLLLLAEFRRVSQIPKAEEFDLSELVDSAVGEISAEGVQTAGPRPMLVVGDAKRIRLALTNGIRNAIESNKAVKEGGDRLVAVNWGSDSKIYWISVVDQGIGIHGNVSGMFAIGRTTKADHFGMGLPVAKQAMQSLGGDIKLGPGDHGGARFEIYWERIPAPSEGGAQ